MSFFRFPVSATLLLAVAGSACAQQPKLSEALVQARASYYTPTAAGLQGFSCAVKVDWPVLFTRLRHTEVSDNDPLLQYVSSARLSVTDDLRRGGSLEWASNDIPAQDVEKRADTTRSGLQQMFHGFFQSWNAFLNGGMVPVPDASTVITAAETGFHLHASSAAYIVDEDFDKDWLLNTVHVTSSALDITMYPVYAREPAGLLVTSIRNVVHQPPTAAPVEVMTKVSYSSVDGYQLPSHIHVDEGNVGIFDFDFTGCRVRVFDPGQITGQGK